MPQELARGLRSCDPSDYIIYTPDPQYVSLPGGDGGILYDIPLFLSTVLSSEVLWDCASVEGRVMAVTHQSGNIYDVHLLNNDDIAWLTSYCADNPCDESALDVFPRGTFFSQQEYVYEGYDTLFMRNADPFITDSDTTIHQGTFVTPEGAYYRIVTRIHQMQLALDEPMMIQEFLPMYILLENDEAAATAAERVLEQTYNELVEFGLYKKRDPNILPRESIWPSDQAGARDGISEEARACIVARTGCARRARRTKQVCMSRCNTGERDELNDCLLCLGLVASPFPELALACYIYCIENTYEQTESCHRTCWHESILNLEGCGIDSQVCCIEAGGCGDME